MGQGGRGCGRRRIGMMIGNVPTPVRAHTVLRNGHVTGLHSVKVRARVILRWLREGKITRALWLVNDSFAGVEGAWPRAQILRCSRVVVARTRLIGGSAAVAMRILSIRVRIMTADMISLLAKRLLVSPLPRMGRRAVLGRLRGIREHFPDLIGVRAIEHENGHRCRSPGGTLEPTCAPAQTSERAMEV